MTGRRRLRSSVRASVALRNIGRVAFLRTFVIDAGCPRLALQDFFFCTTIVLISDLRYSFMAAPHGSCDPSAISASLVCVCWGVKKKCVVVCPRLYVVRDRNPGVNGERVEASTLM